RNDIHTRVLEARSRTDEVFRIVRNEAIYERPIAERHRIIFYVGHVEAFDWNLLAERAFGLKPFQREFDQLFAFGIDPVDGGLPKDTPADWPELAQVQRYNRRLRDELDHAIERSLSAPSEGHPHLSTMLEVAIEHRLMHAETLAYMLHRLPLDRKVRGPEPNDGCGMRAKSGLVDIPSGYATLGLARENGDEFGWDNELGTEVVGGDGFAIERCNVTNGDFLRFVQAGGYRHRSLWNDEAWRWKEGEGI